MGYQEVHGEILTVNEVVHNFPDVRGHDVAVDVAVVFVVESSPSQDHAKSNNEEYYISRETLGVT